MLTINKGGAESAARRDLKFQLAAEQLTGLPEDTGNGFTNEAMQWGLSQEDAIFSVYEAHTGLLAQRSGFLAHTEHMMGCSLDAHVGNFDAIAEFKAPKTATHCRYLRGPAEVPAEHLHQIRHNLYVTGAEWCDFVSYDPRLPEYLRLFHVRYFRDEADMAAYEAKALAFLDEVRQECQVLRGWHAVEAAHV
jgi:hypothetical protein